MTTNTDSSSASSLYGISGLLDERPGLRSQIESFHPFESAALVSGLLVDPSFHANTLRLEMLVHLLVAYGKGDRKPTRHCIEGWLNNELRATTLVHLEDPVEDVFVSNVTSNEGNICVFMGLWENSDFYLQRILNVVQALPDNQRTHQLKREVRAVLRLSEEIAHRRQISRYTPGGGHEGGIISIPSFRQLKSLQGAIEFSLEDLRKIGVHPGDLTPFILQPHLQALLKEQMWGNSDLERHPIIADSGKWIVLLPAAVSIAVRHYFLGWMRQEGYEHSFDEHLACEYLSSLWETRVLGSRLPREMGLSGREVGGKTLLECTLEVDVGRYAHAIIIVDRLQGYVDHGFQVSNQNDTDLTKEISLRVKSAQSHFGSQRNFKQGLTLLIVCGYGRPVVLRGLEETADWPVELVSAPDLETLSWANESSPLMIWKLIDHERFLAKNNISLINASGLLNLYGWWVDTGYLMLHPDVEVGGNPVSIYIPTDCLASVRKKVRQGWDLHALRLPNGSYTRVRRNAAESCFQDEAGKCQYFCIDAAIAGTLLGAWAGNELVWWIAADSGNSSLSRETVYRVWWALYNWMDRVTFVIRKHVQEGCFINCPHLIVLDFSDSQQEEADPVPEEILQSCISVSTQPENATIRISIHDPFIGGFRNPKNVAEKALIRATVRGMLNLAGQTPTKEILDAIIKEIIPNDDARYVHLFAARRFGDYIRCFDRAEKILIDDADEARSKIGLGWLAHRQRDQTKFTVSEESSRFLNRVVDALWQRVRDRLRALNRVAFIERALRHIEGAEAERRRWEHSLRAILALREEKNSTKVTAIREIARLSAASVALRLLIEMAVSECPLDNGASVGVLDLSPLMCDASCMFHLGGWSDAIQKGVMDPEIEIKPCGDIRSSVDFMKGVAEPFWQSIESVRLDDEVGRYDNLFDQQMFVPNTDKLFPEEFRFAFEQEHSVSIDSLRAVRDSLQNLAIEKKKCVFIARKEEMFRKCKEGEQASVETVGVVLDRFALWPRGRWNNTPPGFRKKDWYPWRFGRRLSLVARPLLRLEECDNPRYVISPGLLDTGIVYALQRYFHAEVDVSECVSPEMRRWINEEQNRRGHAFVSKVFETMRSLGYEAKLEHPVKSLLNEKLEKDYGDVDVLAWKPDGDEVLAIECKNLRTARTPNEIAEQLNRFSGQTLPNGEPDDLLRHLDRVSVLNERSRRLARVMGMGDRDVEVRASVCFSKPVPMQYVSSRFPTVRFITIDDLHNQEKAMKILTPGTK